MGSSGRSSFSSSPWGMTPPGPSSPLVPSSSSGTPSTWRQCGDAGLVPSAVEEMLRCRNPVHYMRRTATVDSELSGKQIRAGDKVALYYTSANRDEAVFAEPQVFDIRRTPNAHLSFGIGLHFCLGAHVARLQARVFFEELLSGFSTIELSDTPTKVRSNLTNGYRRLPVRLGR